MLFLFDRRVQIVLLLQLTKIILLLSVVATLDRMLVRMWCSSTMSSSSSPRPSRSSPASTHRYWYLGHTFYVPWVVSTVACTRRTGWARIIHRAARTIWWFAFFIKCFIKRFYFNLSYENFNSKKLSLGKELQYLKLEKKQIFFRTLTV